MMSQMIIKQAGSKLDCKFVTTIPKNIEKHYSLDPFVVIFKMKSNKHPCFNHSIYIPIPKPFVDAPHKPKDMFPILFIEMQNAINHFAFLYTVIGIP